MATAKQMTPDESGEGKIFKTKSGQKMFNHSRHAIHHLIGLENTFYYNITELENSEVSQSAPQMIFTNMISLPSPYIYKGRPEYETKKREYAKALAAAFLEHHLNHADAATIAKWKENQSLSGANKSDVKEIEKSYLAFSHLLTLSPSEAARLTEGEQVKLLFDMRDYFEKRFTNQPECNHGVAAFPHIKWEKKTKQYKSHLHIEMTQMSFDKKKLDLHMSKERMNLILIEMENHPYFGKFLDKTNTLAAQAKNRPQSLEEKELFISLVHDVLGKNPIDVNVAHREFISRGIKLHPQHQSTKLRDVLIEYQGRKVSINQLHERGDKAKTLLHKYFELKDLATPAKKQAVTVMEEVKALILASQNLTPEQFVQKLGANGMHLIPNVTKDGQIKGYSVYVESLKDKVKLSTIDLTAKALPFQSFNPEHIQLLQAIKEQTKAVQEQIEQASPAKPRKVATRSVVQGFGPSFTGFKKRRLMYEYTTIEDYMNEGLGGKYAIALKKNYEYQNGEFVNRRSNKIELKVLSYVPHEKLTVAMTGHTDNAAKALVQMYLENGYKGLRITQLGSIEQSRKIWRAAMLTAGPDFQVQGYNPSMDDLKWLEQEKAKQVQIAREANQQAIATFVATGKAIEFKTVSNQWRTIFKDPMAYAFVDLLRNGLDPMLVMNPPKGKKAKHVATEDDMKAFYHLIVKTVAIECPEHLDRTRELLEPYKPAELTVAPIEPVPAPKPRTAEDVMQEHREEQQKHQLEKAQELDMQVKNGIGIKDKKQ